MAIDAPTVKRTRRCLLRQDGGARHAERERASGDERCCGHDGLLSRRSQWLDVATHDLPDKGPLQLIVDSTDL
jgi:hypothetical protein